MGLARADSLGPRTIRYYLSIRSAPVSATQPGQDFGANDWLVEEMFERYQSDPSSVSAEWIEVFKTRAGGSPSASVTTASAVTASAAGTSAAPKAGTPPIPKSVQKAAAVAQPVAVTTAQPVAQPVAQQVVATPAQPVAQPVAVAPAQPVAQQVVAPVTTPAQPTPAQVVHAPAPILATPSDATIEPLRGVASRVVASMEGSLTVPTATSVRAIPAKLMIDNRTVINNHLKRGRGGKVSFTHIIAYAMIKALRQMPEMNTFFTELDGKPAIGRPTHINLGIAIDLAKPDGSRQLLVPSIKGCEALDFGQFWASYESTVAKARGGTLTVEDFAGTTVSLTNPGTIGTVHSVPRLVQGQGLIIGVGAMDYPAEFAGASEETIARNAISKVITLTSTYDHRIIQGSTSGDFLRRLH